MNKPIKILHLEDLESDAALVERELRKAHIPFEITVVSNQTGFVHALDSFSPDIILSDHSLPGFDSLRALSILKERKLNVPFILVTATVSEEFAVQIMKEGASDYILKDRLQRLPSALAHAIDKKRFESERNLFLQKIVENESLMKEAEKLGQFGSWEVDLEQHTTRCSEETYHLLGYTPGEIQFSLAELLNKIHPQDAASVKNAVIKALHSTTDSLRLHFRLPEKNGQVKYILSELFIKRSSNATPSRIIGFSQDITQHKKSEEELRLLTSQLRALASHLQDIREEERASISREIHDELGQQLTALKIDMAWLSRKMSAKDRELQDKITGSLLLLDDTIRTVRRIATELRPSILDDLGLLEAMKWHAAEMQKRTGIKIIFESTIPDLQPSKNIVIALFRIFQESLTNVIRHAAASAVTVHLEEQEGALLLKIRDNGRGFDVNGIGQKKTLGLLGMKERTLMIGGDYVIESFPGKGTLVSISVPVQ